jgi:hypothetical protein
MLTEGISDVPVDIDPKDPMFRRLLISLRNTVVQLRSAQAPMAAPSNFRGTALAFAALIEWTRITNADYYEILWNTTANLKTATVQGVGDSQRWVDNVGKDAITRYYWVRARRFSGAKSTETGPAVVTTLAAATGTAPKQPPVPGHIQVTDQRTGHIVYYMPVTGNRYL